MISSFPKTQNHSGHMLFVVEIWEGIWYSGRFWSCWAEGMELWHGVCFVCLEFSLFIHLFFNAKTMQSFFFSFFFLIFLFQSKYLCLEFEVILFRYVLCWEWLCLFLFKISSNDMGLGSLNSSYYRSACSFGHVATLSPWMGPSDPQSSREV